MALSHLPLNTPSAGAKAVWTEVCVTPSGTGWSGPDSIMCHAVPSGCGSAPLQPTRLPTGTPMLLRAGSGMSISVCVRVQVPGCDRHVIDKAQLWLAGGLEGTADNATPADNSLHSGVIFTESHSERERLFLVREEVFTASVGTESTIHFLI